MFCNIYVKKMCQKWVPKIPKKLILPYKLLYCMKFQIPLFPHPLADFFCSRVIFWDKISYFKRGKGADVLENYALEPKMVQMTQEFRMWAHGVWLAISGPGGSKWMDQQLDLGGTHPLWSVGDIWTHRNFLIAIRVPDSRLPCSVC